MLQTREVVLPAKDSSAQDWITAQSRAAQREVFAPGQASLIASAQPLLTADSAAHSEPWTNRLIYADTCWPWPPCWRATSTRLHARQGRFDLHRPAF